MYGWMCVRVCFFAYPSSFIPQLRAKNAVITHEASSPAYSEGSVMRDDPVFAPHVQELQQRRKLRGARQDISNNVKEAVAVHVTPKYAILVSRDGREFICLKSLLPKGSVLRKMVRHPSRVLDAALQKRDVSSRIDRYSLSFP